MKKILIKIIVLSMISTVVTSKDISGYLYANYQSIDNVKKTLLLDGFDILGEYNAMNDEKYHIVVFTNDELKTEASKENRGFAAVIKVLVSDNDKELVFTNPEYFLHAFMQDDYQEDIAKSISAKLESSFGYLEVSKDALDDENLAGFHFMFGMPYYEDMIVVGNGENLLDTLEGKAGKNIVFKLQLKHSILLGIAMPNSDGESSYIPKIKGQKHSAFLPYMILIENNKAKILHAKYYLAISYPNLSMGDFMGISSTPGKIEDYISSLFNP